MKRWLPVAALIGAALVVGIAAWNWLGSGGSTETRSAARRAEAGPESATPPSARAAPAETAKEGAAGADGEADHARPPEPETIPERTVDRVGDVDVRGWILVSGPNRETRPREEGWVVLQSITGSPVRCRVAAPLHEGRFTARLPGNAIVTADRVELEEQPALVAGDTFDITESTLLEIHVAWAPTTTLRVIDAASGVELRELSIADHAGQPIERARLLLRPGEERELADSPLALAPPFDRGRLSFQWSELLRVGAPGLETKAIEITYGQGAEFTVELGPAARLVVRLTPWPPPKDTVPSDDAGDVDVRVWLSHAEPAGTFVDGAGTSFTTGNDDITVFSMDSNPSRGLAWSVERNARAPDEQGNVTYEDLAGGRWVATVELATPPGRNVLAHDERLVEVEPGRSTSVTLDLTRPPVAPATLLVRAHDAKDAAPIALEPDQVSLRRIDSGLAFTQSKDEPRFDTISGAVEVVVRAYGDRAWRPARAVALLAPGENVVDLALERSAAIRLEFTGEQGGRLHTVTTSNGVITTFRSQMSLLSSVVLRDARGQIVPGPWFSGRECWWLVEPGRYDLATPGTGQAGLDDAISRIRAVDVPLDAVVTIELGEAR